MKFYTAFALTSIIAILGCSQANKKNTAIPSAPQKCIYTRVATELNSEEVRLKINKVDACKGMIISSELDLRESMDFRSDLRKASQGQFSGQIMDATIKTLKEMRAKTKPFKPDGFVGVATGVFRDSKNAKPFLEKINQEVGLNVQILDTVDEAILGFYSALHFSKIDKKESIVAWHIGFQAQHITFYQGFKRFDTYNSKLGSNSFKSYILKRILRKNTYSPNPINKYQADLALSHVATTARKSIKQSLKDKISEPNIKVIALGDTYLNNVLKLMHPNMESNVITLKGLEEKLSEVLNKKDSDFSQLPRPDTTVSDLLLVLGYMKELKIKDIEVYDINLTDGVTLHSSYWGPLI